MSRLEDMSNITSINLDKMGNLDTVPCAFVDDYNDEVRTYLEFPYTTIGNTYFWQYQEKHFLYF